MKRLKTSTQLNSKTEETMQRSTAKMIRSTPEVKRQTTLQAYQAIEIAIVKVKRKHEACVQKHTAHMR